MTDVTGELAEIRQELRNVRWYVEDDELRAEISAWVEESHDKSDADTAREYVESRLNGLLATNDMYHSPDLPRGEDGFPERCKDLECKHIGGACPVLLDDTEVRWRERELEEASSEQEARQVYQRQAIDVTCPLIPELLEEWDNDHADFVADGNRLLSAAEEAVLEEDDLDTDAGDWDELAAAIPDGGNDNG